MTAHPIASNDSSRRQKAYDRTMNVAEIPRKKAKARQAFSFTEKDLEGVACPHNDVIVISAIIKNAKIHQVLVDTGSFCDIMFLSPFEQMESRG